MRRPSSLSVLLAAAYVALVTYASLYPFTGWYHSQGLWSLGFLNLPWPPQWGRNDVAANLVGYMPLGALIYVAVLHSGHRRARAALLAVALPSLLSLSLEMLQNYLPQRTPSALDWTLNSGGAAIGMLLAWAADRAGLTLRWQALHDLWFDSRSAVALTLLLLWPVGVLFPTPVPLGFGQMRSQWLALAATLGEALQDIGWAAAWTGALLDAVNAPPAPLTPFAEGALTALGLLVPCLLAFTVSRPGWRRVALVLGAGALGLAVMTLSTALSYGPQHALSWQTATTPPAMLAAMLAAGLCVGVSRRTAAALGIVGATVLVVLGTQAPGDPYFEQSLRAWEQGRIRFHGIAQWVGWLWPYAVLVHLLRRVVADENPRRTLRGQG